MSVKLGGPFAHDLARQIEPDADFVIGESFCGQKHYFGANHGKVQCRILPCHCFKLLFLLLTQLNKEEDSKRISCTIRSCPQGLEDVEL